MVATTFLWSDCEFSGAIASDVAGGNLTLSTVARLNTLHL